MNRLCAFSIAAALLVTPAAVRADDSPAYPESPKVNHVDDYHGTKVADPYRWLEHDVRESKKVEDWVKAQNRVTFAFLKQIPERQALEKRLTELWDFEKFGTIFKEGGRYYYRYNSGLQNQSVLMVMNSLDDEPEVLLDPNTWSEDGTVALAGMSFSDDGRYIAYGIQDGGSDWRTWKVMEIESRRVLDDDLKWLKFTGTSWTKDSKGFFYSCYDEPTEGAEFQSLNMNQKVYYHRVGTPQSEDRLVYSRPDQPEWGFRTDVSHDGRYLIITIWKGTDDRFRIAYLDLSQDDATPVDLVTDFDHEHSFLGNDGPVLFFKTDLDAPKRRVIAIDTRDLERQAWKEIIPEADEALVDVHLVGDTFIAEYLKDAYSHVKLFAMDGAFIRDLELPGIGAAGGFTGDPDDQETFYTFSSFAVPPSVYRYDLATHETKLIRRADVDFVPEDYVTEQVFYKSKDGTRVPMFLTHKKGLVRHGNNPTLLYGYGGFNIPLTPAFSISRLAWMEMGGVFAQANLRGGGEYGKTWHKAGTKLQKQNVFDDFIAAAQWLCANDYTRPEKLAIQGRSNGGLLVGACMTQRPDLFGACLPAVGVMDMLRFHQFTAGRFWIDDYGSADNPEEFEALLGYSPYHNIEDGTSYPPTLITTADTDDRVVPGHSFKFAARLQEAHAGDAPVLIRIETRAGHGSGKPTEMIIEEIADQWAFLVEALDVNTSRADK